MLSFLIGSVRVEDDSHLPLLHSEHTTLQIECHVTVSNVFVCDYLLTNIC